MNIMIIIKIMNIINIMHIVNVMNIMNTTSWMAKAGAVLALVLLLVVVGNQAVARGENKLPHSQNTSKPLDFTPNPPIEGPNYVWRVYD